MKMPIAFSVWRSATDRKKVRSCHVIQLQFQFSTFKRLKSQKSSYIRFTLLWANSVTGVSAGFWSKHIMPRNYRIF